MLCLLVWIKYVDEWLQFICGLLLDDELELWLFNDYFGVDLWIELGLLDEWWIKKVCLWVQVVVLFVYNSWVVEIWWQQNQSKFVVYLKLIIWYFDDV